MKNQGNYKDIIKLGFPIYAGMLSNTLVGIVDTALLGQVNLQVQSAAGYGTLFYMVLYVIGYGFSLGPQIIIARRMGEGRQRMAGQIFQHALTFLLLYASLLCLGMLTVFHPFIAAITQSPEIGSLTNDYLYYRSFGVFGTMINLAFMSYYIGIGKSTAISIASVTAGILNLVLAYLLIFGYWGFPELGIKGAAIASSIAELSGTVIYITYSLFFKQNYKNGMFRLFKFRLEKLKEIFKLALPLMLQNCISMVSWFVFFTIIEKTGEKNFGISIILRSIYSLFLISALSIGSATNSIVSNYIGQGRQSEIAALLKRILTISIPFMLLTGSLMFFFKVEIFSIFTKEIELAALADHPLIIIYISLGFFSLSSVFFNAVSGTGLIKVTLLIETIIIGLYLLYTYIAAITSEGNLVIIWSAEIFYAAVLGLVCFLYLRYGNWKRLSTESIAIPPARFEMKPESKV